MTTLVTTMGAARHSVKLHRLLPRRPKSRPRIEQVNAAIAVGCDAVLNVGIAGAIPTLGAMAGMYPFGAF